MSITLSDRYLPAARSTTARSRVSVCSLMPGSGSDLDIKSCQTNHTAEYYHTEQWQPHIWSREMVQSWRTGSAKIEACP